MAIGGGRRLYTAASEVGGCSDVASGDSENQSEEEERKAVFYLNVDTKVLYRDSDDAEKPAEGGEYFQTDGTGFVFRFSLLTFDTLSKEAADGLRAGEVVFLLYLLDGVHQVSRNLRRECFHAVYHSVPPDKGSGGAGGSIKAPGACGVRKATQRETNPGGRPGHDREGPYPRPVPEEPPWPVRFRASSFFPRVQRRFASRARRAVYALLTA